MSCCKRQQQGVVTEVLHRHLICLSPLKEEENNREGGEKKKRREFFFVTDGRGCSKHKSMVGFRSVLQGTVQEYTTASWLNLPHRSESGIRRPKGRLTKKAENETERKESKASDSGIQLWCCKRQRLQKWISPASTETRRTSNCDFLGRIMQQRSSNDLHFLLSTC